MNLHFVSNHTTAKKLPEIISFHRTELTPILSVYGKMVASGEWTENPIYRIEKRPKLFMKQSQYLILGIDGQILKRGNDLVALLRFFDKKLIKSVKID